MICPNCKREVPDTAKACGYCGHWLADDVSATVEVPEEATATVAKSEDKGRPPWLWIGVGLAVVVLVAVVGALAFLAGREGGGAETEATPAAAQSVGATPLDEGSAETGAAQATATSIPPTEIPAPAAEAVEAGPVVYDDFDDPAFDGRYNQTQWRPDDVDIGHFVQENGRLIIAQDGPPEQVALLASREYDRVPLSAPTAFEAKMQLEPGRPFGNALLALAFEPVDGEGYWTECAIHPDWIACHAEGFESEGLVPDRDLMHALRIEVDPATMEFIYYIDGRPVGATVPPNADELVGAEVTLFLGTRAHDDQPFAGYFDEVWVGPVAERPPPAAEAAGARPGVYDDFDDPAFEGDYDQRRWRLIEDSPGDFVQEGGVLIVSQEAAADSATRLAAREYDFVRLERPIAFEARLRLDPDQRAGYLHLALEAEVPEGDEYWWTDCSLYEDWLGCNADLGYQPEGVSVEPGTWHTVRVDVDPATMTFTYSVDGQVEGTFVHPNAEALKNANFRLVLGVWHDEREGGLVGYVDEVRIE